MTYFVNNVLYLSNQAVLNSKELLFIIAQYLVILHHLVSDEMIFVGGSNVETE